MLSLIYFGAVMGNYGVTFWLPQIISETITRNPWRIGLVSMIPWGVAAVTAVLVGASSDRAPGTPVAHRDRCGRRRGRVRALGSARPRPDGPASPASPWPPRA